MVVFMNIITSCAVSAIKLIQPLQKLSITTYEATAAYTLFKNVFQIKQDRRWNADKPSATLDP